MTRLQQRIIIAVDEWAGVILCCWCWHVHREAFWPVFIAWTVAVYVIAYPSYFGWWSWFYRWWRN